MGDRIPYALTTVLLLLLLAVPALPGDGPERGRARVVRPDGAILVVSEGGAYEDVAARLLGVEQYDFDGCPSPYLELDRKVWRFLDSILVEKSVVLTRDARAPEGAPPCEDLRYIETEGRVLVNAEMIKQGYARVDRRFPLERLEELERYEAMARDAGLGLWALSLSAPSPESAASAGPAPPCGKPLRDRLVCDKTPGIRLPELIPRTRVIPGYPAKAYAMGKRITGTVVLSAAILEDGTVGEIHVLRSPGAEFDFDAVAVKAVGKWRYKPALVGGKPRKFYFTVSIDFTYK